MANDSMLEALTRLPLFQGVSLERMGATVGASRFHFLKYNPGTEIAHEGEMCTHVKFVISGSTRIMISNTDGRFRIAQTIEGPDVLCPDFLFGSSTLYPGTITAETVVSIVQISKIDYLNILASDKIFMFNLLNYLSRNAQKCVEGVLAMTTGSIEERLAMWIIAMTQPSAKNIEIICKQRDMYSIFGVQRASFIAALDRMAEAGAIKYSASSIEVLDRRLIMSIMRNGVE